MELREIRNTKYKQASWISNKPEHWCLSICIKQSTGKQASQLYLDNEEWFIVSLSKLYKSVLAVNMYNYWLHVTFLTHIVMFLFKVRKVVRNISTIREIHWYTQLTEVVKKKIYGGGGGRVSMLFLTNYWMVSSQRPMNCYM